MSEDSKELVRRFFEDALNRRNFDALDELLDPDYVYRGVVEGEIRGCEAMKRFVTSLYSVLPDARHVIQEQIAEGDRVVTRFKTTGTPQVEFMGIAPDGRSFTVDEVSIHRIAGGKIIEDWTLWDVEGLRRQFGAGESRGG